MAAQNSSIKCTIDDLLEVYLDFQQIYDIANGDSLVDLKTVACLISQTNLKFKERLTFLFFNRAFSDCPIVD